MPPALAYSTDWIPVRAQCDAMSLDSRMAARRTATVQPTLGLSLAVSDSEIFGGLTPRFAPHGKAAGTRPRAWGLPTCRQPVAPRPLKQRLD
jgi:hypothetical protein